MAGAMGSALEWAMALSRAPGERHALRRRPLPDGIEQLLVIASGAEGAALREAAVAVGETEARVRDAARFYAREVMLYPQADAYRVLGVREGADTARIKLHHRLLQSWLHPDRLQSADDGVFAARVNSAWHVLRDPARRRQYAAALQESQLSQPAFRGGLPHSLRAWPVEPIRASKRWRGWLPAIMLTAACVLLTTLILQDMRRRPVPWDGEAAVNDAGAPGDDGAMGISVPERIMPEAAPPTARIRALEDAGLPRGTRAPRVEAHVAFSRRNTQGTSVAAKADAGNAPPPGKHPQARATPVEAALPPVPSPVVVSMQAPPSETQAQTAVPAHPLRPLPAPDFPRLQSAQSVGMQLLRFMGDNSIPPPPIWASAAIRVSAEEVRHQHALAGQVRFLAPRWRIGSEVATLKADYGIHGSRAGQGSLVADFAWRDGRWLVTAMSMERARE